MLATAIISFREFLEVFLIIGVFLGISKKLRLRKEREIIIAAFLGIIFSFLLTSLMYIFGDYARGILSQRNTEILQSYLLIFSAFFIAYVVFSLHGILRKSRGATIIDAQAKLQQNAFDLSLFLTIIFLVVREGFEIALFTATVSLFESFLQNLAGLFLGFVAAGIVGFATLLAYLKSPFLKVMQITEYAILLLGASLLQNGLTKFFSLHLNIQLSGIMSLPLGFLPDEETLIGHLLQNLFGLDRQLSLGRLAIMLFYMALVYLLFLRSKKTIVSK